MSFAAIYNNFLNSAFVPLQGLREPAHIDLLHERHQSDFLGWGGGIVGRDVS